MSRRKKKRAPTVGSEIAKYKHAQDVLAFLHGYTQGGAECFGLDQAQCAEVHEALSHWLKNNWDESLVDSERSR